jgi:hypothetical protein
MYANRHLLSYCRIMKIKLRQYRLSEYARELGFVEVETIDEDLGRSSSGLVERPGFQRLGRLKMSLFLRTGSLQAGAALLGQRRRDFP